MRSPLVAKSLLAKLSFALALSLPIAALGVGCGGNVVVDHGGDGDGDTGGSSSHPPSQFGTPDGACIVKTAGIEICEQIFDAGPVVAAELKKSCSASHGETVTACSTSGLIGCCLLHESALKLEECFYGGMSATQVKQSCSEQNGKFTSSP
jgi:hypothetical protein